MHSAYVANLVGNSEIEGRKPIVRSSNEPNQKDDKSTEVGLIFSLEFPATDEGTLPLAKTSKEYQPDQIARRTVPLEAESFRSSSLTENPDVTTASWRPENTKTEGQIELDVANQRGVAGDTKVSKVATSLSGRFIVAETHPTLEHIDTSDFQSKTGDVSEDTPLANPSLQNPGAKALKASQGHATANFSIDEETTKVNPTDGAPADAPTKKTSLMTPGLSTSQLTHNAIDEVKLPHLEPHTEVRVESHKMLTEGHESLVRETSNDLPWPLMNQTSKTTALTSHQSISDAVVFPAAILATNWQLSDIPFDPISHTGLGEFTQEQLPQLSTRTLATGPSAELPRSVAVQIAEVARSGPDKPVELTLNPEELGRLKMTFQTEASSLNVVLQVERPETQELIRRHIGLLAQEMQNLGYAEVTFSFQQRGHTSSDNQSQPESREPLDNPRITSSPMPDQEVIQISVGEATGVDIRI